MKSGWYTVWYYGPKRADSIRVCSGPHKSALHARDHARQCESEGGYKHQVVEIRVWRDWRRPKEKKP